MAGITKAKEMRGRDASRRVRQMTSVTGHEDGRHALYTNHPTKRPRRRKGVDWLNVLVVSLSILAVSAAIAFAVWAFATRLGSWAADARAVEIAQMDQGESEVLADLSASLRELGRHIEEIDRRIRRLECIRADSLGVPTRIDCAGEEGGGDHGSR